MNIPGGRVVTTLSSPAHSPRDRTSPRRCAQGSAQSDDPGAERIPEAGFAGTYTDATQRGLYAQLQELTDADLDLSSCSSARARVLESYNASLRAINMGYTSVFWYRGAWRPGRKPASRSRRSCARAAGVHRSVVVVPNLLVLLLVQLGLLLVAATLLGQLAQRVRLPAIVGELRQGCCWADDSWPTAGGAFGALFPSDPTIVAVRTNFLTVGLLLFILLVGLEIDIGAVRQRLRVIVPRVCSAWPSHSPPVSDWPCSSPACGTRGRCQPPAYAGHPVHCRRGVVDFGAAVIARTLTTSG